MLLTSGLAQQVIDSIMPLLQQNVNIMDSSGTIIASCQVQRIGTFHKGAHDVLEQNQTVEITPEDVFRFPGSLPGVNMPILMEEQVIGVVGITGHPEEVRGTAKLVKAVTELILERDLLMEKFRSQEQLREHFADLLLSEHAAQKFSSLAASAKLLKYDMTIPRQVIAINMQTFFQQARNCSTSDLVSTRLLASLLQQVRTSPCISPRDFVVFLEQRLIVLKETPTGEDATLPGIFRWGEQLGKSLFHTSPLLIGAGSNEPNSKFLCHSYQEALFALTQSTPLKPVSSIQDPHTLAAYALQHAPSVNCRPLLELREALHADSLRKFDMAETIFSLLEHNLNISLAAKALFIHRNTLLFRLGKLRTATGLDPCHHFDHAILCRQLLDRY